MKSEVQTVRAITFVLDEDEANQLQADLEEYKRLLYNGNGRVEQMTDTTADMYMTLFDFVGPVKVVN